METPFTQVKKAGHSRENVFDVYGEPRENLLEFLAAVVILSPISPICCTLLVLSLLQCVAMCCNVA